MRCGMQRSGLRSNRVSVPLTLFTMKIILAVSQHLIQFQYPRIMPPLIPCCRAVPPTSLLCFPLLCRSRDFFGKALNDHIDPDVTVAYGAASILD